MYVNTLRYLQAENLPAPLPLLKKILNYRMVLRVIHIKLLNVVGLRYTKQSKCQA